MRDKALDWWENLSMIESIVFERKYGYYGHDQGVTEDEIIEMFKGEKCSSCYSTQIHINGKCYTCYRDSIISNILD